MKITICVKDEDNNIAQGVCVVTDTKKMSKKKKLETYIDVVKDASIMLLTKLDSPR